MNILSSMKLASFLVFFGIFLSPIVVSSQEQLNQLDSNGEPHGVWRKFFEGTEQLRYEGKFKHGKETGEFKFYCEDCKNQPVAIKKFNDKDDIAQVEYFTIKGKLVSKGNMRGKDRIGEWITYHKDAKTVMLIENYTDGKLNGKKITYYPNGKITEELEFSNGEKNGPNLYYSPEGITIKKLEYKENNLHGAATYYDAHGNLIIEGSYKDDKKHGLWKYYKDGKLVLEETFPKKNGE